MGKYSGTINHTFKNMVTYGAGMDKLLEEHTKISRAMQSIIALNTAVQLYSNLAEKFDKDPFYYGCAMRIRSVYLNERGRRINNAL